MKRTIKAVVDVLALLLVLPAYGCFRAARVVLGPERAFRGWSEAFSLLPGLSGVFARRAFYRLALPRCGPDCCLRVGTIISHHTTEIGRSVYVGPHSCLGDVTLEDDVLVSSHVSIMNGGSQHGTGRLDEPIREQPSSYARVSIGRDTWIGERAVVQADVGRHCIVGAGAVVTKPIPDYAVAVGIPARITRFRNAEATHHSQSTDNVSSDPTVIADRATGLEANTNSHLEVVPEPIGSEN